MDSLYKEELKFPVHPQVKYLLGLPQYEQRTPEWFSQREGCLTGSLIDTVLGDNPYQSPIDVLFNKCGISDGFNGNEATRHGNRFEDDAIALYNHFRNKKTFSFGLLPHPEIKFLAGSPDDITHDGILIEVKCPLHRKIIQGKIPKHYLGQVRFNMEVCGLNKAVFIEYKPSERAMKIDTKFKDIDEPDSGKYELNIVDMNRDPEWFVKVYPKLEKFWNDVIHYRTVGIKTHPNYIYMVRKCRDPKKLSLIQNMICDESSDEEFEPIKVKCFIKDEYD
jgi:putative phage-type endonuclease